MFTYITLGTNNMLRAVSFYDAVMATLGLSRCNTNNEDHWEDWAGWGTYSEQGRQEVALWLCKPFNKKVATVGNGTMIAFKATNWQAVDDFHAAALKHGGDSEGSSGLRLEYNADFYTAYVRDPDGNKLAAVCRGFTAKN